MQLKTEDLGGLRVFRLSGEIDHASAPELFDALDEQLPNPLDAGMFIDMADVPYIDSAGLGVLSKLVARCDENGWVGVISPSREVFRLFEIAGITTRQSLVVLKDREEALEYLEQLSRPRIKRERPIAARLLTEEDWDEDEAEEGDEDQEPLWGDESGSGSGKERDSDW
jgi:anti-sigma B factor antagonist